MPEIDRFEKEVPTTVGVHDRTRLTAAPTAASVPPVVRRHLGPVAPDAYAGWDDVYVDNVARVYRMLYAKVGNRADTEDLTTEVFLAAYGPLRIEASRPEVRAYLAVTARTVLASFWRRRLRTEVTSIVDESEMAAFEDPDHDPRKAVRIARILDLLPSRQREVLQLRFLQARSVKETASAMRISVANVKVIQHRALRLAAQLAKETP